jgi:acylphosphatase
MNDLSGVRAVVSGRVQGVGFRYSAAKTATRLGLVGWVRNRIDGSVEVHCEGAPDSVAQYLKWLENGPPGAQVTQVDKRTVVSQNCYRSFTIDY